MQCAAKGRQRSEVNEELCAKAAINATLRPPMGLINRAGE